MTASGRKVNPMTAMENNSERRLMADWVRPQTIAM